MIYVATCLGTQHNPWLLALALIVCCLGAQASMRMISHVIASNGAMKLAWTFLTSLVLGTAVWTTHFIAMLAYLAHAPVSYDPTQTILSLLIAVAGTNIALAIATLDRKGVLPALGGGLLGLVIAWMHFAGMLAFKVDGMVTWDIDMVTVAVLLAVAFGSATLVAVHGQMGVSLRPAAPWLLMCAILALHFTGMAALTITPIVVSAPTLAQGASALALATSLAATLVIAAGLFAYLIDARMRQEADDRVATTASTDALTGLPNRHAFSSKVQSASLDHEAYWFGVLVMEIANIDMINQQFGLPIADSLLQAFARRLLAARTPDVYLARTGGAEFCGIFSSSKSGQETARQLHAALSQDFLIEGRAISIDLRFGTASSAREESEPYSVLSNARSALSRAIADPLNKIVMHDGIFDAVAQRRITIASELRGALGRNEFELYFQPQVWISNRHVIGYEALLRWQHPTLGMISPAEFIPLAEKTGDIVSIGAWVLQRACKEAASWGEGCIVAVNLSPLQLRQTDLVEQVSGAIADSGLRAGRLEIEITESLLIEDRVHGFDTLHRIKALGVRVALDDFGTGYSSMDVLRQFPFDKVKLDKSFLDEVGTNRRALAMLHAMIALGRELSIPILVEGVESEWQLAILRQAGCKKVQGFLTGRPLPAGSLVQQMLCADFTTSAFSLSGGSRP